MEEIMQSNSFFIVPLTLAYGTICGCWYLLNKVNISWPLENIDNPKAGWKELVIAIVTSVAVLAVGRLYAAGLLIPSSSNQIWNGLSWVANNFIIYSPIFITLYIRKQSTTTVFLSAKSFPTKLIFGLVSSLMGIIVFLGVRNELSRLPEILSHAVEYGTLTNFPAVFFENVAVAFLFVRLKWTVGIKWAIIIPSVLFALAHVPGSIAEGDPWTHILTFFFLTGGLTTFILYTAYRSRDVIWLGIVHYLMDVAIKAF